MANNTIGNLKAIVDQIVELHGPDARLSFAFQRASGRVGIGDVTSYVVMMGTTQIGPTIRFNIDYPRGKEE